MFFSSEDIVIADNHITNNRKSSTNGPINAGVYFAYPGKDQFSGDLGYKNVVVYNNTVNNTANGAWKQRLAWVNSNTSRNIQFYGNTATGDAPIYVGGDPPMVATGTNNFTLENLAQTPLSVCLPEIGDPSFEMPAIAAGTSAQDPQDTFEQYCTFVGTAGIASNGSNLGNPNAPDGTQVGYVQGQGSISQSVWFPGGKWKIALYAAGQDAGNQKALRVLVDGRSLNDFSVGQSFGSVATRSVTLREGNHVITFKGIAGKSNDVKAFIDKVSFIPA